MATFSSRGPIGDFLKPDVTAPGIQVLAGTTPQPDQTTADNGPPGQNFMAIAGTSMSSPHSAGVSALVKAAHPDWTPAEIKSALMTSSVQSVVKEDGVTPADPFDDGAGSIRADRAVNPTLVFDETYDGLRRLGDRSAAPDRPQHRERRRADDDGLDHDEADGDERLRPRPGPRRSRRTRRRRAKIFVSDKAPGKNGPKTDDTIHLKKNGTTDSGSRSAHRRSPNGQYFGRITLDPQKDGLNDVTIPVAFVKRQGS